MRRRFTPIQSGLLLMRQALAAISVNWVILRLLARFGHREVLVTNTIIIGMLLLLLLEFRLAARRLRQPSSLAISL